MRTTMTKRIAAYTIMMAAGAWLCTGAGRHMAVRAGGQTAAAADATVHGATLTPTQLTNFGRLPLTFEPNLGQSDPQVRFISHGGGHTLFLTGNEAVMVVRRPSGSRKPIFNPQGPPVHARAAATECVVRIELLGANPEAKIGGLDQQAGRSSYFIGRDPSRWRTDVPTYEKVKYTQVLRGVDLVYYGNQGQLESDFVVAPQADPASIALAIHGGESRLDAEGNLIVSTASGDVTLHRPVAYQSGQNARKEMVASKFVLLAGAVRFAVGDYDRSRSLVIDPVLTFSTFLGGSGEDRAAGIGVDRMGNVYVAGSTESSDFPTKNSIQGFTGSATVHDVFVVKFNPTATALIYSTYIGGTADQQSLDLALDAAGNAYVGGFTLSPDFPVTAGAFQTVYGGDVADNSGLKGDAFLLKLNAAGNALTYASYLGGGGGEIVENITLDPAGNAYVAGSTSSSNFPVTSAAFQKTCPIKTSFNSCFAGFAAKVNTTGSTLVYATYLVDTNTTNFADTGLGIAVDRLGDAYVVGEMGAGWITTAGAFQTICVAPCTFVQGYVAKLNPTGSGLVWSTYLGSTTAGGASEMESVKLDSANNVYLAGLFVAAPTADFPVTAGAAQTVYGGGSGCITYGCGDMIVSKLNSTGSALIYSTYLGGTGDEAPFRMALDSQKNVYVTGESTGFSYPLANAVQAAYGGGMHDAVITELNAAGSAFTFSSFLGGSAEDVGRSMTLDASGNIYITGRTASPNYPVTTGAFQPTCGTDGTCNGGVFDALVSKISPKADLKVTNSAPGTVNSGATLTYTIVASSTGPDRALSVKISDSVPAGTTFSSVSAPAGVSCTHPVTGGTGLVACTIPALANGGSVTETLVVTVTAGSGSTIVDKAVLVWGGFDPTTSDNSATARTRVN